MANKTDLYKANLNICDIHRQYFGRLQFNFHLAHGEGQRQVLLKLLASCLYAADGLKIDVSAYKSKKPDLYITNEFGRKSLCVLLGMRPLTELTRACREAEHVVVMGEDDARWRRWWVASQSKLVLLPNLSVATVKPSDVDLLLPCLHNRVSWHVLLDHETLWLNHSDGISEVIPRRLKTYLLEQTQVA